MTKQLSRGAREAIRSLRGEATAEELAKRFRCSERTITRIWKETAAEEYADRLEAANTAIQQGQYRPLKAGTVQYLTLDHYLHLVERREYYSAMADAYPSNCAWGTLEAKYNKMIADELRTLGKWCGLEEQSAGSSGDLYMKLAEQLAGLPSPETFREAAQAVLKLKV